MKQKLVINGKVIKRRINRSIIEPVIWFIEFKLFGNRYVWVSVGPLLRVINVSVFSTDVFSFQHFLWIPSISVPIGSVCWKSTAQSCRFSVLFQFVCLSICWIHMRFRVNVGLFGCRLPLTRLNSNKNYLPCRMSFKPGASSIFWGWTDFRVIDQGLLSYIESVWSKACLIFAIIWSSKYLFTDVSNSFSVQTLGSVFWNEPLVTWNDACFWFSWILSWQNEITFEWKCA